jgi:Tol biopolymer transport system component
MNITLHRPALVRLALGVGALMVVIFALTGCGSGSAQQEAKDPKSSAPKDSPIASETGWLAYQTGQGDFMTDEVHLVRVDGSHDHVIATNLPGRQGHPDFSPDGSRLAFDQTTSEESADQIYVAKADGSAAKRISECKLPRCVQYWEPAWSPDGSHLAISTSAGPLSETGPARFGIATIDVNSEKVTQVVDNGSKWQDHFPRWSPDGKRLVFWRATSSDAQSGPTAIFIVNVDGSGLRQLTPWKMLAGDPD